MTKEIKDLYRKAGLKSPDGKGIHTKKFHECVVDLKKKGSAKNPYAVCMASIGAKGAVKPSHYRGKTILTRKS